MDKVRILYDHQMFDLQNIGGISRYFFELISAFEKDEMIDWELSLIYSNNEYLKQLPLNKKKHLPKIPYSDDYKNFLGGTDFRGKGLVYKLKNKIIPAPTLINNSEANKAASIQKIKEGNFDIFHPTYYDDYFLDYIGNKPFVLTVHDLIHQIFPEFLLHNTTDKNKVMLEKAKKIIAISESTKKDLINIFGISEQKIEVVYLASSLQQTTDNVSEEFKRKIPENFLLFVGGRSEYKNFMFFAQMFSSLKKENKNLNLVCTGLPFNSSEQYLFNKIGIQDVVYNTYVNDNELVYLYKNAKAFVFPSMYEGFGLPVLEAFSCGCPVLVSNSSSLKEIGGEAVIFFEPKDPSSMLNALTDVLNNSALRINKIEQGYIQLEKYSWEKTAKKTKKVYKDVFLN